jgi:catechol 2,3-dioxygenase-like lactoylglutathione lyase family enzyme
MSVVAFSHVAIRVSDLDRSLELYRDRFGFRPRSQLVVTDAPSFREAGVDDLQMLAWFGHRDGCVVELQAVTSRSRGPIPIPPGELGFRHLAFRARDVEQTARALEFAGGTIDWATRTRTQNVDVDGEALFGADPAGQRLELLELAGGPEQPVGAPLEDPGRAGDGTVDAFDYVAVGVADLARATAFYSSEGLAGEVEARGDAWVRVRIFSARILLEQASSASPRLGIRRLAFVGEAAARIEDPDGPELVVRAADGRGA